MKQLIVVAEDRVGLLADISYLLGKAKINIEIINVGIVGTKAVVQLFVTDDKKAREVLAANNYEILTADVLLVKIPDTPGELSKLAKILADNGINIEIVNTITRSKTHALYSLKVDKPKKAEKLLKGYIVEDAYLN
ncbi:ACT domain-containing protein [Candidatus Parvarchaeota archaeon]|nr:ACT domain-containing protein [Candidatus Parvarchaeota archaeon]